MGLIEFIDDQKELFKENKYYAFVLMTIFIGVPLLMYIECLLRKYLQKSGNLDGHEGEDQMGKTINFTKDAKKKCVNGVGGQHTILPFDMKGEYRRVTCSKLIGKHVTSTGRE